MAQAKKRKIFDNRYEILSIIGRGSRSVVYHARHIKGKRREVALKVLIAKKGKVPTSDLLRKEALAMVSSRHKYVIRLDDFHSLGDLCYLAMELAPMGDLRQYTTHEGAKLLPSQAELFFIQAAEALEFIHKAGILHRDIKPDNLLVIDEQNIRLGDFGVAILPGETSSLEELQKGIGTMNYMSPEVLDGKPYDARCDIYALGVSFYEMLAGVHPFEDAPLAQQIDVRKDDAITPLTELNPDIPNYLSAAIMQSMAFDPNARYQNCRDLIQSLLIHRSTQKRTAPLKAEIKPEQVKTAQIKHIGSTEKREPLEPAPAQNEDKQEVAAQQEQAKQEASSSDQEATEETLQTTTSPGAKKKRRRRRRKRRKPAENTETALEPAVEEEPSLDVAQSEGESPEQLNEVEPQQQQEAPAKKLSEKEPKRSTQDVRHSMEEALRKIEEMSKPTPKQSAPEPAPDTKQEIQAESKPAPHSTPQQNVPTQTPNEEEAPQPIPTNQPASDQEPQEPVLAQQEASQPEPQPSEPQSIQEPTPEPAPLRPEELFQQRQPREPQPHMQQMGNASLSSRSPSRSLNPQMIVGAVILALLLLYITPSLFQSSEYEEQITQETTTTQTAVPTSSNMELSFPNLPAGLYGGKMVSTLSEESIPLSIISLPDLNQLVVVVGIVGWEPQILPYNELSPDVKIRLASNGTVLTLTGGQIVDDKVIGLYINQSTQDSGEWQIWRRKP